MKNYSTLRYLIISIGLLLQFSAEGQVKYVNEFLNIGAGARAHGMSGSVVGHVEDGTAGYWNTAGLVHLKNPGLVDYQTMTTSVSQKNWGRKNYPLQVSLSFVWE